MEQEKKCENCCFFKEYYAISDEKLLKVGGFCRNDEVYPKCTPKKYNPQACDKWQPKNDGERVKVTDNIIKKLNAMHKRLDEIALILNNFEA